MLPLPKLETIDVHAAARAAGVAPSTIRRWCEEHRLPAFKLIGRWRIPRREFAAWLSSHSEVPEIRD